MSFWDYLTAGKKYRDTDDDYGREYSRPRKVEYRAYCKKCGFQTTFTYTSKSEAVSKLQLGLGSGRNACGNYNHLAETEEVEV